MKSDKTIESHPSWLADGLELRCLTPQDRAKHKAMSDVIYEAKRQGIRYMLATAHPDNIASNTSLQQLGYKIIKEFTRAGKRRNLLVMDLKEE
ncbi:MAG: hypothetical protein Q4B58_06830 [Bacteroidales bacterium]|nr:hypothetical protein [Bacteroidales bacterium]